MQRIVLVFSWSERFISCLVIQLGTLSLGTPRIHMIQWEDLAAPVAAKLLLLHSTAHHLASVATLEEVSETHATSVE